MPKVFISYKTREHRQVIPHLPRGQWDRKRPEVLPDKQRLYDGLQTLLRALVVLGMIVDVLERIWNAITWLPRFVLRTARAGLSRVRASLRQRREGRYE
jgi:hypothetical protein